MSFRGKLAIFFFLAHGLAFFFAEAVVGSASSVIARHAALSRMTLPITCSPKPPDRLKDCLGANLLCRRAREKPVRRTPPWGHGPVLRQVTPFPRAGLRNTRTSADTRFMRTGNDTGPAWRAPGDGARGTRTPDLLGAIQALSQLSYSPAGRLSVSGGVRP